MPVELRALFTGNILEITETTSVQARIIVEYERAGTELVAERTETMEIQSRKLMTWDDDRKAAAFVTAGDPAVQRLSRNVTAITRQIGSFAVNERLRQAIAIHETIGLLGIQYVIDPDSSYAVLKRSVSCRASASRLGSARALRLHTALALLRLRMALLHSFGYRCYRVIRMVNPSRVK